MTVSSPAGQQHETGTERLITGQRILGQRHIIVAMSDDRRQHITSRVGLAVVQNPIEIGVNLFARCRVESRSALRR